MNPARTSVALATGANKGIGFEAGVIRFGRHRLTLRRLLRQRPLKTPEKVEPSSLLSRLSCAQIVQYRHQWIILNSTLTNVVCNDQ
jgi:hypothetical protein